MEDKKNESVGVIQEIGDLGGYTELSDSDKKTLQESKENNNVKEKH